MDPSERPTKPFPSGAVERAAKRTGAPSVASGIALVLVLGVAAGGIGYAVGHSESRSLSDERAAGTREGRVAGAARGNREGYKPAFDAGRRDGYRATYKRAYQDAYKRATGGGK